MLRRLNLHMTTGTIDFEPCEDVDSLGGRGFISSLLEKIVDPTIEPFSEENLLILSTGLLAGTPASTSGRLSIGTKSPLTGTIKESNVGGTAALALTKLGIRSIVISGAAAKPASNVLLIDENGARLEPVGDVQGLTTYATTEKLFTRYGKDNAILCVGPAGEFGYRTASVQVTDMQGRPSRAAGRGGVGAILAIKGIKAIVVSKKGTQNVTYADEALFKKAVKQFTELIRNNPLTGQVFPAFGTAVLVGMVNEMGAFPTRNFSNGSFEDIGGLTAEHMAALQEKRKGKMTHACQAGCIIQCSNVYNDKDGNYLTSGFEYETIGLTGGNLAVGDLDVVATIDRLCDEMGVDTMETGTTLGVAMEAGLLPFGDTAGVLRFLEEMKQGTPLGRDLGEGTTRFGKKHKVNRIPTVKGQGLAAYDPRGLKGTGVTCATSPMGADHTCGNTIGDPNLNPLAQEGQVESSAMLQQITATIDCLGLCIFAGGALTPPDGPNVLVQLLEGRYGGTWDIPRVFGLGQATLTRERAFNRGAGFTKEDDDVPAFMRTEPLAPHNSVFDISKKDMEKHCS